ncbi:MAG: DNA replication/repair protein RecF [Pseudomonadota bacterium]
MIIDRLSIRHLRAINMAELDLAEGVNLFIGNNGAGKTSVLEAVHILATGRSFRAAQLEVVKQQGQQDLTLAARVRHGCHGDQSHQLGLCKQSDGLILRRDGAPAERLVDLARDLAVITLHADSDQLILGAPQQRRRYLDWWLFHAQPEFFPHWSRYQRLLKQRNAALRTDPRQLDAWDTSLAEAGEQVSIHRQQAAERLMDSLAGMIEGAEDFLDFNWTLHPGWTRQESLIEVLQRTRSRDREQGFTSQGPHRAELRLQVMGKEAREVLSRGQQKTLATLMLLSQARTYRAARGDMPVFLLDDLAAELDDRHRERLLGDVIGLGGQVLLTALDEDELTAWLTGGTRRFGVQAGQVTML